MLYIIKNTIQVSCYNFSMCIHMHITAVFLCAQAYTLCRNAQMLKVNNTKLYGIKNTTQISSHNFIVCMHMYIIIIFLFAQAFTI